MSWKEIGFLGGGTSWIRTSDTRIFSPLLYQLYPLFISYLPPTCFVNAPNLRPFMFTAPKIVNAENLNARCYFTFRFNGKRYRFYNGNAIVVDLNPNTYTDDSNHWKMIITISYALVK